MNDANIIDTGVKALSDFGKDDLLSHFIYCGLHYSWKGKTVSWLKEIFLTKMKKYEIESATLTLLEMWRWKLVTKETVKKAYQGKLKNDEDWKRYKRSVGDNLETFFHNLQDGIKIKNEWVFSFFTPKLTEEELKFVQEQNKEHLSTYSRYYFGKNPDVDPEKMKKTDSRSKYVRGSCGRLTIQLTLKSNP